MVSSYAYSLLKFDVSRHDCTAESDILCFTTYILQLRLYAQLSLVECRHEAAHPWVLHYHITRYVESYTSRYTIKTSRHVRHPVPSCSREVRRRTCNAIRTFVCSSLFLVCIGDENCHGILSTFVYKLSNIEFCAHHVSLYIARRPISTSNLMTIEIEIGIAIGIIETKPHVLSLFYLLW